MRRLGTVMSVRRNTIGIVCLTLAGFLLHSPLYGSIRIEVRCERILPNGSTIPLDGATIAFAGAPITGKTDHNGKLVEVLPAPRLGNEQIWPTTTIWLVHDIYDLCAYSTVELRGTSVTVRLRVPQVASSFAFGTGTSIAGQIVGDVDKCSSAVLRALGGIGGCDVGDYCSFGVTRVYWPSNAQARLLGVSSKVSAFYARVLRLQGRDTTVSLRLQVPSDSVVVVGNIDFERPDTVALYLEGVGFPPLNAELCSTSVAVQIPRPYFHWLRMRIVAECYEPFEKAMPVPDGSDTIRIGRVALRRRSQMWVVQCVGVDTSRGKSQLWPIRSLPVQLGVNFVGETDERGSCRVEVPCGMGLPVPVDTPPVYRLVQVDTLPEVRTVIYRFWVHPYRILLRAVDKETESFVSGESLQVVVRFPSGKQTVTTALYPIEFKGLPGDTVRLQLSRAGYRDTTLVVRLPSDSPELVAEVLLHRKKNPGRLILVDPKSALYRLITFSNNDRDTVFVDQGQIPDSLEVPEGRYIVLVQKDGYWPIVDTVEVKASQRSVFASRLRPIIGDVVLAVKESTGLPSVVDSLDLQLTPLSAGISGYGVHISVVGSVIDTTVAVRVPIGTWEIAYKGRLFKCGRDTVVVGQMGLQYAVRLKRIVLPSILQVEPPGQYIVVFGDHSSWTDSAGYLSLGDRPAGLACRVAVLDAHGDSAFGGLVYPKVSRTVQWYTAKVRTHVVSGPRQVLLEVPGFGLWRYSRPVGADLLIGFRFLPQNDKGNMLRMKGALLLHLHTSRNGWLGLSMEGYAEQNEPLNPMLEQIGVYGVKSVSTTWFLGVQGAISYLGRSTIEDRGLSRGGMFLGWKTTATSGGLSLEKLWALPIFGTGQPTVRSLAAASLWSQVPVKRVTFSGYFKYFDDDRKYVRFGASLPLHRSVFLLLTASTLADAYELSVESVVRW